MKIARRIVAIMLAALMTFALLAGCGEQAPAADDSAAIVASETSVEVAPVVEEVAAVEEAVVEEAVVEEVASAGTAADSDVVEEVRLYMIDSYGWNTFESAESAVITTSGGTFTLSVTADKMNFMRIASVYLKDYSCRLGSHSKTQFSSVTITLDKVTFNGTELSLTNNGAEEAIGSNGVFDYCFINQWYTPGLKVANCVIPEGQGSFMFDGVEYLDGRNTMEVTFTIAPISADKILDVEETYRQLQGIALSGAAINMAIGDSSSLVCNTTPAVCKDYIYGFDSKVVWSSSDPSVATVSNGAISAVGKGTATITATYGSYSSSCTVSVVDPADLVSNIKLYGSLGGMDMSSSNTVVVNPDSAGTSHSFTIVDSDNGANGWNLSRIITLYIKDADVYDGKTTETYYQNANITVDGIYWNGKSVGVIENEFTSGAQFDIPLINVWSNYNGVTDSCTTEDAGWATFVILQTEEDGKNVSDQVDWGGSNTLQVDITINDVD